MLQILLALAFPVLVYFALHVASPRTLGLAILALYVLRRAVAMPKGLAAYTRLGGPITAAIIVSSGTSSIWNDPRALLLGPALVNVALLATFAASFAASETIVETLARTQARTLSAEERAYCRAVTAVWCVFFLANAGLISGLALYGTRESWALYTGALSYLAMGALFSAEFVYRHWRFRRYVGLPTDALLRKIFPPKPTE